MVYCILFSTLTPPRIQWLLFENGEKFLKHNWVPPVQFPHLTYQFFRGQSCKIFSLIFPEGSGYFCCIRPWKISTANSVPDPWQRIEYIYPNLEMFSWYDTFQMKYVSCVNTIIDKIYILFISHGPSLNSQPFLQDLKVWNCVVHVRGMRDI